MNRVQLIQRITEVLKEKEIKKPISIPKYVFHVSDDEGNTRDFFVKKREKTAIYTKDDVAAVLDTCLSIIEDALKNGEEVYLHGFGSFGVKYRAERSTRRIDNGEPIKVPAVYVPRFTPGKLLKMSTKVYGLSLEDKNKEIELPDVDDDEEFEEE